MLENYSKQIQTVLKNIKIGDRIAISKNAKSYEGLLMPKTELGDKDCIVIKLDSGYNIGIRYEKGVKVNKSKKHEPKEVKEETDFELEKERIQKLKFDTSKPRVSIIMTGGTIISRVDYKTGGVHAL